ncbi:hypothetical protein QQ045_011841 [Rhodiola kirilowii]
MYQTVSWSGLMGGGSSSSSAAWLNARARPPSTTGYSMERIERMAGESAVVIFSLSSCCMCHAIKRLFCGMGVHPTVYELDQLDPELETTLLHLTNASAVPVVFIGGKLVGSMDRVMACHINGSLVPLLKNAGALWL